MAGAGPKGKSGVLDCGGDLHGGLDVGGFINPFADGSNLVIYICEGDLGGAPVRLTSPAGAIPADRRRRRRMDVAASARQAPR